jgi:hypothetical protein
VDCFVVFFLSVFLTATATTATTIADIEIPNFF